MELQTPGARKYPTSALLRSSAGLGWSTISAELRSHPAGDTPAIAPHNVELCLTVAGNDEGLVIRTGAGQRQESRPSTGTICLSPVGVVEDQLTLMAPIPETLHLYLRRRYSGNSPMISISRERRPTPSVTSPAYETRSSIK